MSESVTANFMPEHLLTCLIIGMIAGLLAGLLVRGRGIGLISSVVLGLMGALAGGFLLAVLGIQIPSIFTGWITLAWTDVFIVLVDAVIILLLIGGYTHRRSRAVKRYAPLNNNDLLDKMKLR